MLVCNGRQTNSIEKRRSKMPYLPQWATWPVVLTLSLNLGVAKAQSPAQPAAPAPVAAAEPPTDIVGIWQGTLTPPNAPKGVRFELKVAKGADGAYNATLFNADTASPPGSLKVTLQGTDVKLTSTMLTIGGKLSADGKTIDGIWGGDTPNPLPVSFARTSPDEAWPVPEPPKPMAAEAAPGFDVATVKPSKPDARGKLFTFRGTHLLTFNTNMNDLVCFAYGLHTKQILGAPDWFGNMQFDIDGVPDVPGRPSHSQMQLLVQKILADRFALKFHKELRELSVYIITVASAEPKMEKSDIPPGQGQNFIFRGLGDLNVTNNSMTDFANGMQGAVMDKPVVDHTGLKDRYNFRLKWTPDDSQFAQLRGTNPPAQPPAGENPDAPPSLYTAMPEQIGLKIEAGKAMDDVIVIDHVEQPSPN